MTLNLDIEVWRVYLIKCGVPKEVADVLEALGWGIQGMWESDWKDWRCYCLTFAQELERQADIIRKISGHGPRKV